MNDSKLLMEEIVKIADSKKARDIVVLQVDDKTTLTDYFVIMTGTSNTHIRALGDEIEFKVTQLSSTGDKNSTAESLFF